MRAGASIVGVLAMLAAAAGCSGSQPAAEQVQTAAKRYASEVWAVALASGKPLSLELLEAKACVGMADGQVHYVGLKDGAVETFSQTRGGLALGGACSIDRYVGIDDASRLVAKGTRDDENKWAMPLGARLLGPPVRVGETSLLFHSNGFVQANSLANGDTLWRLQLPDSEFRFDAVFRPVVDGSTVFFGIPEGELYAVDAELGVVLWKERLYDTRNPDATGNLSAIAGPAINDEVVCAAAFGGKVGCFGREFGAFRWRRAFSSPGVVALGVTALFVTDNSGALHALNLATGEDLWTARGATASASPLVAHFAGTVALDDGAGVTFFSAETGAVLGRHLIGEVVDMATVGNDLLVLTSGGALRRLATAGS